MSVILTGSVALKDVLSVDDSRFMSITTSSGYIPCQLLSVPVLFYISGRRTYGQVNSCLRVYSPEYKVGARKTYDGRRDQHRQYVNEELGYRKRKTISCDARKDIKHTGFYKKNQHPFCFRLLVHDTLETLNNLFPIPPVPQLSKRCVQSTKKLQAHHAFNDMI